MAFLDSTGLSTLVSMIKANFLGINDTAAYAEYATIANSALMSDAASSAQRADALGSSDVGDGTNPIYLDEGTALASDSTVGDAYTPIYMNSGTLTVCDFGQEFVYTNNYVDVDIYGVEDGDGKYHAKLYVTGNNGADGLPDDITFPVFFKSDANSATGGLQVAVGAEGELYTRTTFATASSLGDATLITGWDNDWVKYATEAYVDNAISTVDVSSYIPNSGDAGVVSTYCTVSEDVATVNDDSPSMIVATDSFEIENGTEGKAWVKTIYLAASIQTITAGSKWKWMGKGNMALYNYALLICYWCGSVGIIEYVNTVSEGSLITQTSLANTLADYATIDYVDTAISELSTTE